MHYVTFDGFYIQSIQIDMFIQSKDPKSASSIFPATEGQSWQNTDPKQTFILYVPEENLNSRGTERAPHVEARRSPSIFLNSRRRPVWIVYIYSQTHLPELSPKAHCYPKA
jgi:hypothetical protein